MKVLIIDNYDSFTFNLYQTIGEVLKNSGEAFAVEVKRNDQITVEEIKTNGYDRIVISPGPGNPSDKAYFGICSKVLTDVGKTTPVLGVCLGMQGMAYYFVGRVKRASQPMHGKTSIIIHDGKGVFQGLPQGLEVMRYHSLVADPDSLPEVLEITARVVIPGLTGNLDPRIKSEDDNGKGEIMGLRHKEYPIEGIQFHPESFATEAGKQMLENFLFELGSRNQELRIKKP